jgi:outer membrane protein assembly factor BamB
MVQKNFFLRESCAWALGAFFLLGWGLVQGQESDKINDGLSVPATDWPWWRGPSRNGTAASDQAPPIQWDLETNVVWKTPIPGRGYGSMCLVADKVYLATADEASGSQSVVCLDRKTGRVVWSKIVHEAGGMRKNEKSTAASCTPACDGRSIYVGFPNDGRLMASALGLDGQILWQTKITDYIEHQGYGASPALYQSLVIIAADTKAGGAIAGLDRTSGKIIWRRERPKVPNYPSPVILNLFGKDQLIMTGCDLVTSLNPLSGELNWEVPGATTECVTSTLSDGKHVYSSGGYPRNHMSAVLADGSGKLAWENDSRVYVPSLLIRQGTLYGVLDAGIAVAWDAASGKELWRNRLGGSVSASPVLVAGNIYAWNEAGECFVYRAKPEGFELVAKNQLGEESLSTPVICDSRIYYRCTELVDGKRQEFLYCLGAK